jgi:hypothetical protein
MPSDSPSQPELPDPHDEVVDAIVYDVHPALAEAYAYPYLRPAGDRPIESYSPAGQAAARFVGGLSQGMDHYFRRLRTPPDFAVPKQFGILAILGITTALALLFGGLKWGEAHPVFYLFFGTQALAICLVQMFVGQAPRASSTAAGAIIMPLFAAISASFFRHGPPLGGLLCVMVLFIPVGALIGYITGTCAAGVFLIMDYLEPYLKVRSPSHPHDSAAGA